MVLIYLAVNIATIRAFRTDVAADDIHERAIFVEEDRQRIHIMRVPCVGEVCYKLIRNLGHAWNPAG